MPVGATESYRLVFARDESAAEPMPGLVIATPAKDEWNDSGFQLRIKIIVVPRRESKIAPFALGDLFGLLAFTQSRGRPSDVRLLEQIFESEKVDILSGEKTPPFFTMLPDMQAYRQIVRALGPEEASLALQCLHDMVEAENGLRSPAWLQTARNSRVFHSAFLRTSEAFFAWKNASMLLHGAEFEHADQPLRMSPTVVLTKPIRDRIGRGPQRHR